MISSLMIIRLLIKIYLRIFFHDKFLYCGHMFCILSSHIYNKLICFQPIIYKSTISMLISITTILFIFLLFQTEVHDYFYINSIQTTAYYQCYKQQGSSYVILPLEPINPEDIPDAIQNMINAKNAGLGLGVILFLCRTMTPEEHIDIIVKNMGLSAVNQFWVFPDLNVNWSEYSRESNCLYFQKVIEILKRTFEVPVGVISN